MLGIGNTLLCSDFTSQSSTGQPSPTPSSATPDGLPCQDLCTLRCRYYGLQPNIKVISPWREWDLNSRSKLIAYAEANNISVPASKRGEPPFSMDANLLHISYEG